MCRIFYKYRTDSKYTEDILISGQVFLSTADDLNDPFECSLQEIGKEWIKQQVTEMKQASFVGFFLQAKRAFDKVTPFFGLTQNELQNILDTMKRLQSVDDLYSFERQFILEHTGHPMSNCERFFSGIDAQLLAVGIFSMSVIPDHPLMWAHYAHDHTGICLGFEQTPGSQLDNPMNCLPVIYSDLLPEMEKDGFQTEMTFSIDDRGKPYNSGFKIAFSDKTFQRAITTKPTCWSYEEEWRYVEPYSGLFRFPGKLSELTFGLRCSEERRNHYIHLAEEYVPNEVRLFQMQKVQGTNALMRSIYATPVTKPKNTTRSECNVFCDTETLNQDQFVSKMERLLQQEKYGEVQFQVNENLKMNPDSPILLHLKGVAHGYAHEHEKALETFTRLTEVCPEVAQAWYQMSCALVELDRHDEAIIALKKAYSIDPNEKSIAFNLGIELLRGQGKTDEALIYLRRAESLGHRRVHQIIAEIENN